VGAEGTEVLTKGEYFYRAGITVVGEGGKIGKWAKK